MNARIYLSYDAKIILITFLLWKHVDFAIVCATLSRVSFHKISKWLVVYGF